MKRAGLRAKDADQRIKDAGMRIKDGRLRAKDAEPRAEEDAPCSSRAQHPDRELSQLAADGRTSDVPDDSNAALSGHALRIGTIRAPGLLPALAGDSAAYYYARQRFFPDYRQNHETG